MSPKTPRPETKKDESQPTKPVASKAEASSASKNVPEKPKSKTKKERKPRTTGQKVFLWILILLLIFIAAGAGVFIYFAFFRPEPENSVSNEQPEFPDPIYSLMTGEEITDASLNSSPTFCVQIPNGNDGGRPQAGLGQAAVVFEAIAERGITRFAAIFQNPTVGVIGPIRSLRSYYLDWDTPFDCTVVHAGGSDEALADIRRGGQRDLDESNDYMWRETGSGHMWNNLFTSPANLAQFNATKGYTTSNPKTLPRLTPEETDDILAERDLCAGSSDCIVEIVDDINIQFGASPTFNTVYFYDAQCGDPIQLAPSVVIAMVVQERTSSDGYHEAITTIGTGPATIFQNGQAIEGTWTKSSQTSQIVFRDANGDTIQFTPGQIWIAAVPQYGRIEY